MAQMSLFTKQKQTHGHREQACGCQGVGDCQGGWERGEVGGWVSRCKPLYIEQLNNEVMLYRTENCI